MTEDSLNAASASASIIAARRALASYSLRRDRNSPFHGKLLVPFPGTNRYEQYQATVAPRVLSASTPTSIIGTTHIIHNKLYY